MRVSFPANSSLIPSYKSKPASATAVFNSSSQSSYTSSCLNSSSNCQGGEQKVIYESYEVPQSGPFSQLASGASNIFLGLAALVLGKFAARRYTEQPAALTSPKKPLAV